MFLNAEMFSLLYYLHTWVMSKCLPASVVVDIYSQCYFYFYDSYKGQVMHEVAPVFRGRMSSLSVKEGCIIIWIHDLVMVITLVM